MKTVVSVARRWFDGEKVPNEEKVFSLFEPLLEPLIPPKIGKGEDRKVNQREVVNGILYVLRTGCQWDYLPHDLLPKGTTYYYR